MEEKGKFLSKIKSLRNLYFLKGKDSLEEETKEKLKEMESKLAKVKIMLDDE